MILAKKREQQILKNIQNYATKNKHMIQVKNAFATLCDSVFIQNKFSFASNYIIPCIKASTGEWKECIFPYNKQAQLAKFENFELSLQRYLISHKSDLENRSLDKNAQWFEFGRSQAINDVYKYKIAINTLIKDISTIKINEVQSGCGVYSGLYILTDISLEAIKNAIMCDEFIDYIATIGKCKSGGYYTFSSSDLKQYLYYKLEGKKWKSM